MRAGEPGLPPPTATAVIVPVPDVEAVVARHRRNLDVAAAWGIPAHVTVLSPFVLPADLSAPLIDDLRTAVATVGVFDCTFSTTGWFGDEVVWLRPDDDEPFRVMSNAVWKAFPAHPPYGGVHAELVPHLTVGETRRGDTGQLRQAEALVRAALPLSARIWRAWLVQGSDAPGSWRLVEELPLSASSVVSVTRAVGVGRARR